MIHEVFSVFLKSVDNRTERIGKIGNPMPFFMFIKSKPAQTNLFTAENIMFRCHRCRVFLQPVCRYMRYYTFKPVFA